MKATFFIFLQYLLPQHFLSRVVGKLADCKIAFIKNFLIRHFARIYQVNLSEAKIENIEEFTSFNDFFCRELKEGARTLDTNEGTIASPVDGAISQLGAIKGDQIFQAKGRCYSIESLLGGDKDMANLFIDGEFATIYLSPKDYHRIHMPIDGTLIKMLHVPGALFSVNPTTTENLDSLFARNERAVCLFNTAIGPVAMVYVGAMIVASIETPWAGLIAPAGKQVQRFNYSAQENIQLKKGDEAGRFKLGSTVIMLFPKQTIDWQTQDGNVRLGEALATQKLNTNV